MSTSFFEVLELEGISQADLSRTSGVSTTTINKICRKKLYGKPISRTTKGKLVNAINRLATPDKKYAIQDIDFE